MNITQQKTISLRNTLKVFGLTVKEISLALNISKRSFENLMAGTTELDKNLLKKIQEADSNIYEMIKAHSPRRHVNKINTTRCNDFSNQLIRYYFHEAPCPDIGLIIDAVKGFSITKSDHLISARAFLALFEVWSRKNSIITREVLLKYKVYRIVDEQLYLNRLAITTSMYNIIDNELRSRGVTVDCFDVDEMSEIQDLYVYHSRDVFKQVIGRYGNPNTRTNAIRNLSHLFELSSKFGAPNFIKKIDGYNYIQREYADLEFFRENYNDMFCQHIVHIFRSMYGYDRKGEIECIHPAKHCVGHNPDIDKCTFLFKPTVKINSYKFFARKFSDHTWFESLLENRGDLRNVKPPFDNQLH